MPEITQISVEDAQQCLPALLEKLKENGEYLIVENDQPIARLLPVDRVPRVRRRLGGLKGTVLYIAADFDAPLEDFQEYME